MGYIGSAWNPVRAGLITAMNLRFLYKAKYLVTSSVIISCSINALLYKVMKYFIFTVLFGRFIRLVILDSCH